MNTELSKALNKNRRKKFPGLNLTAEDMCQITITTLSGLAGFLRKRTSFNSARLFKYASEAVGDFLTEKEG